MEPRTEPPIPVTTFLEEYRVYGINDGIVGCIKISSISGKFVFSPYEHGPLDLTEQTIRFIADKLSYLNRILSQ
jgi:hypothetical protein